MTLPTSREDDYPFEGAHGSPEATTPGPENGKFAAPTFRDGYKKGYKIGRVASR